MKSLKIFLLSLFTSTAASAQEQLFPLLDCKVLNEAIQSVSTNTSGTLLTDKIISPKKIWDTVYYPTAQLFANEKMQLNILSGNVAITSYINNPTQDVPDKIYLEHLHLQIFSCIDEIKGKIEYSAIYDDRLYEEIGNVGICIYRSSAGFAIDIYSIDPLNKKYKLPMPNVNVLAEIIKDFDKMNYANHIHSRDEEALEVLPNSSDYNWRMTNKQVFDDINAFMINASDSSDYGYYFSNNTTQYHPTVRKKHFVNMVTNTIAGLKKKGIKIVKQYKENEHYFIETAHSRISFSYIHDMYDMHTANVVISIDRM